jgi:hypothetical protein
MDFQPKDHLMQIKNKNGSSDYLPVQWRLVWFREACPDGSITTELVHLDLDRETEEEGYAWNNETKRSEKIVKRAQGIAIFRATIKDGKGGEATGTKSEKAASFPDFIEKAETGSIGRALAALGYGTQFAPELDEQPRIVDAPVAPSSNGHQEPAQPTSTEHGEPEQSDGAKTLFNRCRARAYKLGIKKPDEWAAFRQKYAKKDTDEAVTVTDIGLMNGELTIREKNVAKGAA